MKILAIAVCVAATIAAALMATRPPGFVTVAVAAEEEPEERAPARERELVDGMPVVRLTNRCKREAASSRRHSPR